MSYFEYFSNWRDHTFTHSCGWTGKHSEASQELFNELFELNCPQCEGRLAVISLPTATQIKNAAKEGNAEALEMLDQVNRSEQFAKERTTRRKSLKRLPKQSGDRLEFTLSTEGSGDWMNPSWLILNCNGEEIYRERSGFEHWEAVIKIGQAIHSQFTGRIAFFDPGQAAVGLLGDNLSASGRIQAFLNETHLAPPSGPWAATPESP